MTTHKLNYGEWGEIYALLKLVAQGSINQADENESAIEGYDIDLVEVIRHESKYRTVVYRLPDEGADDSVVIYVNQVPVQEVPVSRFAEKADELLAYVQQGKRAPFAISPELGEFFEEIEIAHFKALSTNKSDIFLSLLDPRSVVTRRDVGYSIKTKWSQKATLFNTGNGSRAVFRVVGDLREGIVDEVNSIRDSKGNVDVRGRIARLKDNGLRLEFDGYAYCRNAQCRAFQENLALINPRLIDVWQAVMQEHFENGTFSGGSSSIADISDWLVKTNPCGIERGEVHYPYMLKSFLYASYCGMTASTLWDGRSNVNGGLITVGSTGDVLAFNALESDAFKSYLFNHCCIDYPSTSEKHGNYGRLYQVGEDWFFDLNFQIRFNSY